MRILRLAPLALILVGLFSIACASAHKTFTPSNGLTGEIARVIEGNEDTIWAYTFYQIPAGSGFEVVGGVSKQRNGGNWTTYEEDDGLISEIIYSLAIDGEELWIGTINGISVLDESTGSISNIKVEDGLASNEILSLAAGLGKIWIGTNNGASVFDKSTGEITSYGMEDGLVFRYVLDIAVDEGGGKVYFATSMGVGVFEPSTGEWSQITTDDGLLSNTVNSAVFAMDSVWFGTEMGVSRYLADGGWEHYDTSSGLPAPGVTAMAASDTTIWFLTLKGLAQYKPEDQKWKIYDKGLPLETLNDVGYGRGYAWVGTNEGLIRIGTRIPTSYLLIGIVVVAVGSIAVWKLRPIMQRKAERASGRRRKVSGPPPWRRCKGTPSEKLCPLCKYNELKGSGYFCTRYQIPVKYEEG